MATHDERPSEVDDTIAALQKAGMAALANRQERLRNDPMRLVQMRFSAFTPEIKASLGDHSWTSKLEQFDDSDIDPSTNEARTWLATITAVRAENIFRDITIVGCRNENDEKEFYAVGSLRDVDGKERQFLVAPLGVTQEMITYRLEQFKWRQDQLAINTNEQNYLDARRSQLTAKVFNYTHSVRMFLHMLGPAVLLTVPFVIFFGWWFALMIIAFYGAMLLIFCVSDTVIHKKVSGRCEFGSKCSMPTVPSKPASLMRKRELNRLSKAA